MRKSLSAPQGRKEVGKPVTGNDVFELVYFFFPVGFACPQICGLFTYWLFGLWLTY